MDSQEIDARLKKIKLLVMDLDGVLTDGRIIYDDFGDQLKSFDSIDGLGLVLLQKAGLHSAIITSKKCNANKRRAKELHITNIYQNVQDKLVMFDKLINKLQIQPDESCVMGDDLVDAPMMLRSGVAVAVQNAVPDIKKIAHYVTTHGGGRGAVREMCEMILKTQGKWESVTKDYFM